MKRRDFLKRAIGVAIGAGLAKVIPAEAASSPIAVDWAIKEPRDIVSFWVKQDGKLEIFTVKGVAERVLVDGVELDKVGEIDKNKWHHMQFEFSAGDLEDGFKIETRGQLDLDEIRAETVPSEKAMKDGIRYEVSTREESQEDSQTGHWGVIEFTPDGQSY